MRNVAAAAASSDIRHVYTLTSQDTQRAVGVVATAASSVAVAHVEGVAPTTGIPVKSEPGEAESAAASHTGVRKKRQRLELGQNLEIILLKDTGMFCKTQYLEIVFRKP